MEEAVWRATGAKLSSECTNEANPGWEGIDSVEVTHGVLEAVFDALGS